MFASIEERAAAVLAAAGAHPSTKAASGRYRRSDPIRPGVRYWSTSTPRHQLDQFGVQFYGRGLSEGRQLEERLRAFRFEPRAPQSGQMTFARAVRFAPGDLLDHASLAEARRELDVILEQTSVDGVQESGSRFLDFMRNSPLAGLDLDLDRHADPAMNTFTFLDFMAASPLSEVDLEALIGDPDDRRR